MLIPKHWSRADSEATTPDGKRVRFHVWRGSVSDLAEAEAAAKEAVERMAARIRAGQGFPERYAYGDRPLREEIVQEIGSNGSGPTAAVTRNSYGALVLNTDRLFFIDVDAPADRAVPTYSPAPSSSGGRSFLWDVLEKLLGREASSLPGFVVSLLENVLGPSRAHPTAAPPPAPAPGATGGQSSAQLQRLRSYVATRPDWRVRVYRTSAGMRYLVTHAPFSATDGEAESVMKALGADEQYVKLCRVQKSFRARLTPKPWRVGVENPPVTFPYENGSAEAEMRAWEGRYDRASEGYATCQLLEEVGAGSTHPDLASLVTLHDQKTKASSGLPLA